MSIEHPAYTPAGVWHTLPFTFEGSPWNFVMAVEHKKTRMMPHRLSKNVTICPFV